MYSRTAADYIASLHPQSTISVRHVYDSVDTAWNRYVAQSAITYAAHNAVSMAEAIANITERLAHLDEQDHLVKGTLATDIKYEADFEDLMKGE